VRRLAFVGVVLAVAVLVGCGDSGVSGEASGGWQRLPNPPLSPREAATAVAVGDEVLIMGGSDARPCPPGADCALSDEPPLRDGAALDPAANRWKRIAPAPVGFSWAYTAVIGEDVYLLIPGETGRPGAPAAFLRYDRRTDQWSELPLPRHARTRGLVATDSKVVAFAQSHERGRARDWVFDPAHGTWSALPDDPLPRAYGRVMAWSGHELVLFAAEAVPNPGSKQPSVVIAAAFDPATRAWRRMPDSQILGTGGRWFPEEGRMILPALGGADGGETANWGRTYPNGGILDLHDQRWRLLPDAPGGDQEVSAGVVAGDRADIYSTEGWILDAAADEWLQMPTLRDPAGDATVTGRAIVAAGRDVITFGGARWSDDGNSRLLADAWAWTIPRPPRSSS
jgi:hypothetical protein